MWEKARNYILLLSIACFAYMISGVCADCVVPNCRQSVKVMHEAEYCLGFSPYYVNTGSWLAPFDEGDPVSGSELTVMFDCYPCYLACEEAPNSAQEAKNSPSDCEYINWAWISPSGCSDSPG